MAALLIAAISVGFTSCSKDNKEPQPDPGIIMGKWHLNFTSEGDLVDTSYYLEFKRDNTYSYMTENETFNGMYKIIETEKITQTIVEKYIELGGTEILERTYDRDTTVFKMLVSGSSDFDQLWVYAFISSGLNVQISISIYSNNNLVQDLGSFSYSGY